MIKDNIQNKTLHGIWRIIPSPAISEIIAQSGFDFQILDCEHGTYDYITLGADIRSCEVYDCLPIVRVSGLNKVEVQRCLDMGAHGIVFPQLSGFEDFKQATLLMKYAPEGNRGFNPFVRAKGYGIQDNSKIKKPLCIAIIETLDAMNDLDKILTLKEIDIIYIGSYDLSAQLGCIGQMDAPALVKSVDEIIKKCIASSKPVAMLINNPEQGKALYNKGVNILVHAVESIHLKKGFIDSIKHIKENLGRFSK